MARNAELGEFEQLVLFAALRLRDEAYAPAIAALLEERAEREMSRGTLYAALDRLENRGMLTWRGDETAEGRGGSPRRRFTVTPEGIEALVRVRRVFRSLWDGLDDVLPEEAR